MDFDNRKVYGDTSITDGLVLYLPPLPTSNILQTFSFCEFSFLVDVQKKDQVAELGSTLGGFWG